MINTIEINEQWQARSEADEIYKHIEIQKYIANK